MASTATAENVGVRLKRKVRSAETKLFEWRPCSCTIVARDGKLLLQLQTPPRDEDSQEEDDSDSETVIIDLATQLLNVVPKKNKARCDLEYYAPVATMRGDVLKEELMAPSAAHCQQWIAQVRRVQQQAHQQRRPSSTRPTPSPVAPLPSPLTNHSELNGSRSTRSSITNGIAAVGSSVQSVSVREPSPLRRQNSRAMSGSELGHPEMASSSSRQSPLKHHSNSASLPSSAVSVALPDSLAAVATAASCRVRERCDNVQANANDSEMECTIDSSSGLPAAAFEPTARSDTPPSLISSISSVSTGIPPTCWKRGSAVRVSSPYYSSSSSSENEMPHSHRRSRRSRPTSHERRDYGDNENNEHGSDEDHEPIRYRRQNYRRGSEISDNSRIPTTRVPGLNLDASSSTHRSPLHQSPTRTRHSAALYSTLPRRSSDSYEGNGESSQAELHILQRVEAALRALELENAQAKARERELVQEVQTLRDTARVTAAERKHIEHEYRHARREIDSWRRAAQGAEAAAAQLQEQLGIAREENQLLAGEKLRLKRQNSELLTQVHRLDSLVYGRF